MDTLLLSVCQLFIQNRDILKSTFPWDNSYLYPVCASVFTDSRTVADAENLRHCRTTLKQNTGIFSSFRSNVQLPMISMLSLADDPDHLMKDCITAYDFLKKHYSSSEYLPLAAMIIAKIAQPDLFEMLAERSRFIYTKMREEHPFLTSSEDCVYATLLAFSPLEESLLIKEIEACYTILKETFFSRNAVQSLSHVLALGEGSPAEKCQKTIALFNLLKNNKLRYGTDYELATLGVLAMIPLDIETIAAELSEVSMFLQTQKGYGFFGFSRTQRLMHAATLVGSAHTHHSGETTMRFAAFGTTLSMIAAQQAAMCAAIAAAAAARSASN